MRGQLGAPLGFGAHDGATDGVAFAPAAIFDRNDFGAIDARHIAAREARERPAHRFIRLPEMQQMLLGFVRVVPDALGARRGRIE
jgi:hypothetical protein